MDFCEINEDDWGIIALCVIALEGVDDGSGIVIGGNEAIKGRKGGRGELRGVGDPE